MKLVGEMFCGVVRSSKHRADWFQSKDANLNKYFHTHFRKCVQVEQLIIHCRGICANMSDDLAAHPGYAASFPVPWARCKLQKPLLSQQRNGL